MSFIGISSYILNRAFVKNQKNAIQTPYFSSAISFLFESPAMLMIHNECNSTL